MAQISLRAYLEYIEGRLMRDAYTEVVAQCRHILERYPKHVGTYRLLARALIAQQNYQDALDLFQRILSADPNDFIAHIGISECYRETNLVDQAIWHLERAFEQTPNNLDIQAEIKKLYKARGDQIPRKIRLTGGALARLYAKGDLYAQAIKELEKTIASDPERLDLQALLASVLWDSRQEIRAGRVAAEVLKRLPLSIDANAVLARLWLRAGQPAEARPFLNNVKELDPYLGYEIESGGKAAPPDLVTMDMLDYEVSTAGLAVGAADWVSQLDAIDKKEGITGPLSSSQITEVFGAGEEALSDTPGWLQDALNSPIPESVEDPGSGVPRGTGWLDSLMGMAPDPVPAQPAAPSPPLAEPPIAPPAADTPDWLAEALGEETPPGIPRPGEAPTPDWLQDVLETPEQPLTPLPAPEEPAEATPDWLSDALGAATPPPLPRPDLPPADDAQPDWLAELQEDEDTPVLPPSQQEDAGAPPHDLLAEMLASSEPEQPLSGSPDPDAWLAELAKDEPAPPAAQPGDFESWLDDLGAPSTPEVATGALGAEVGDEDTPTLAPEAPPSEADQTPSEMPDWFREQIEQARQTGAEPVQPAAPEEHAEESGPAPLPEWLASEPGSETPGPAAPDEAGEEIPEWLQSAPLGTEIEQTDELKPVADDIPEWLKEAAAGRPAQDQTPSETETDMEALPAAAHGLQEGEELTPFDEPLDDNESPENIDWDSDDALAWLEELAAELDPSYEKGSVSEEDLESSEQPSPSEEGEEQPDWLSEVAPEEEETPVQPAAPAAAQPAAAQPPQEDKELPDWLRHPTELEEPSRAPASEGLPDWLRDEAPAPPQPTPEAEAAPAAPAAPAPPAAEAEEEALAWLDQQVEAQGVQPGEPVSETLEPDRAPVSAPDIPPPDAEAEPASDEELPEWLKDISPEVEAAAPVHDELDELPEPEVEEEDLAWLSETLEEEPASAEEAELAAIFGKEPAEEEEEEELPAWLRDETPAPAAAPAPAPRMEAEPEEEEEEELPAWLRDETPAPAAAPAPAPRMEAEPEEEEEEELPAWLREETAAPAAAMPAPPAEEEEEEELPAWLREEAPAPAAEEEVVEEAEELPDWLVAEEEPEAEEMPAMPRAEEPAAEPAPAPEPAVEPEELPAWLQTPAEPVDAGLESFLKAAAAPPEEPEVKPAAPAAPAVPLAPAASAAPEPAPPVPAPAAPPVGEPGAVLQHARQSMQEGEKVASLDAYESLVSSGQLLEAVIDDLNALRAQGPVTARVNRLLGDALMSTGRLQEALEIFRSALDQL